MAEGPENNFSQGGMKTKIEAAKVTTSVGCNLIIANGQKHNPLKNIYKVSDMVSSVSKRKSGKEKMDSKHEIYPVRIIIDFRAEKALNLETLYCRWRYKMYRPI